MVPFMSNLLTAKFLPQFKLGTKAVLCAVLLIAMNTGGLIWAWRLIPDPVGMILQNFAFLLLIWVAAEKRHATAHA